MKLHTYREKLPAQNTPQRSIYSMYKKVMQLLFFAHGLNWVHSCADFSFSTLYVWDFLLLATHTHTHTWHHFQIMSSEKKIWIKSSISNGVKLLRLLCSSIFICGPLHFCWAISIFHSFKHDIMKHFSYKVKLAYFHICKCSWTLKTYWQ